MMRWLAAIAALVLAPHAAVAAEKTIEFFWAPYARAAEVARLEVQVADAAGNPVAAAVATPTETTARLPLAEGATYRAALSAVTANGERSEAATLVVALGDPPPPPPAKLPAPEGFGWRFVAADPPPPPADSPFLKSVVLRKEDFTRLTAPLVFPSDPKFNTAGKSCGLAFKFRYNAAPNSASPLSLWDDAAPILQLRAISDTRLDVLVRRTGGQFGGLTHLLDPMTGRDVDVVVGFDVATKTLTLWVDKVKRDETTIEEGIGFSPTQTPPLVVNSQAAGHNLGDLTPIRLLFAVGAAPTQADVDALFAQPVHAPGFVTRMVGETIEVAAYGPGFADRNHETPKAWIDGQHVPLAKTRDNRPIELRYTAAIPANVGAGTVPLKAEWRWNGKPAPDAVIEASGTFNRVAAPRPQPAPPAFAGVAHIRRDGSSGHDLRDDSEIYVGAYGFGAGEFADDRWGLRVRDEMLAANFGVEGGSILHYQKQAGGWQQWLAMTEQMRIANGTALKRWPGPWSVPDDDFLGPDALAALMAEPGWEGYIAGWCDWRNAVTTQRPRFVLYKDEVNLAFGSDPDSTTQPLLVKLVPFGGMGKVVDALRASSRCPIAPGMFGVDSSVPVGYSAWMTPRYSDFVAQYHQPNLPPAPWSGQTLRQATETLRWAAKHRDPARPLSLNFGLIVDYFIRDAEGKWFKQIAATDPKSIPGQIWVNVSLGATVLRGYALASYDARQPSGDPAVPEYQQAVKPGERAYYAMLAAASMVRDYAPLLLGAEQPLADAGPDFLCGHRRSPRGRVYWAVNLSEVDRPVPEAAIPPFPWNKVERLAPNGKREIAADRLVPANGVLVLSVSE